MGIMGYTKRSGAFGFIIPDVELERMAKRFRARAMRTHFKITFEQYLAGPERYDKILEFIKNKDTNKTTCKGRRR